MANIISFQNGNFNAANFHNVETAANAQQTTKNSGSTGSSTSYNRGPTAGFSVTNNAVAEGILLFINRASGSATGTFTVSLYDGATDVREVTVNVTDIPYVSNSGPSVSYVTPGTWMFFKFASTYTLNSALTYKIGIKSSVNSTVNVYYSSSSPNWTRLLRVDTTATPAAADAVFIAGEWTAAATYGAISITMDVTTGTATAYGSVDIGSKGTLAFGNSTYTDYRLKVTNLLSTFGDGLFSMGTSDSPIPGSSTALLEFQSTNVGMILTGGTFKSYGSLDKASRVTNKVADGATATLTLSVAHGFAVGESITVAEVDATFNGTYITTAVTATTLSYALAATVGTEVCTAGTVTKQALVSNKALTNNIATLTTSANHGLSASEWVLIAGVDSTFNGRYQLLTASGTTLTYAKTAGDVASQGCSGTVNGQKVHMAHLAVDRTGGGAGSAVTTDIVTNWVPNDYITVASTTRTASQAEIKLISTVTIPVGTILTMTTTFTNAHSGTSPTQAELTNQTRNVIVRSSSSSNNGYIQCDANTVINCFATEFAQMGYNGSSYNHGIDLYVAPTAAIPGSATFQWCSWDNVATSGSGTCYWGVYCEGSAVDSVTISYCVFASLYYSGLYVNATTGTTISIDNSIIIGCGQATNGSILLYDNYVTITNVTITSSTGNVQALLYTENSATSPLAPVSGLEIHSCQYYALNLTACRDGYFYNLKIWRNNSTGIILGAYSMNDMTFDTVVMFGNNNYNLDINCNVNSLYLRNMTIDGDIVTYRTDKGLFWDASYIGYNVWIINCTFGLSTPHSTADWYFNSSCFGNILGNNVYLNDWTTWTEAKYATWRSTTANFLNARAASRIGVTKWNQTSGLHKMLYTYGQIQSDSTFYKTSSPSERLSPVAVTTTYRFYLESSPKRCAIMNGRNTVVSVWVRTSVVGDGAAYNGNRAKLVLKASPGAGIPDDTVIDTATVASDGAWEQLSGPTPTVSDDAVLEFVVQCNGTAGFINTDDWSVT